MMMPSLQGCGFQARLFGLLQLAFVLCAWPVRAEVSDAQDREARKLFEAGEVAYAEARYERSLKYFQEAYALSQRHILLYNVGTSLDRMGRDQEAIDAYLEYLDKVPGAKNEGAVRERIRQLEARVAERGKPPPVMTPDQAAQSQVEQDEAQAVPAASTGPANSEAKPVYKQWWLWASIGAVVVVGATLGIVAANQDSSSDSAEPLVVNDMTRVREL